MKTQLMQGPFNLKIKAALNHDESNEYYIVDQSGFHLAKVYNCNGQFNEAYQVAQAEQVLKAVNMHEELIEALFEAEKYIDINCADTNKPQGRIAIQLRNKLLNIRIKAKGGAE